MADSTQDTDDGPVTALATADAMPATVSVGMPVGSPGTAAAHGVLDHQVSEATRRRVAAGVAANTTTAYTRQWAAFTAWCAAAGRVALPATGATLAEYAGHLAELDRAPATIAQAVATIRTHHRLAGHPAQPDTDAARLVQRSHRRERAERGHRPGKATPITIEALRAMVETCDPATLTGARDRAVLVLGVAMMARRSELAALNAGDVAFTDDGLLVYVRASKTDQDAHGVEVAIPPGVHADTDPVRVVAAWQAALAEHDVTGGRLLRSIDRHGRIGTALSTDAVDDIVRAAAHRAAAAGDPIDPAGYSAHSLRAGGATIAAKAHVPVSVIAEHGRWQPGSPVVLSYIRAVDRWRDNAMRGVGL